MNQRENALRILQFDHPERVTTGMPVYELCYQGCNHETITGEGGDGSPVGAEWEDIWGTRWHKIQEGVMGLPRGYPLGKVEDLQDYTWPDPDDERICGKIGHMKAGFPGGDRFLGGSHRDTLWEKAYMLVGMENLMIYFLSEPGFVREVLHRIMDFQLGMARHYLSSGVEFVSLGDDLGTQCGPLLGPRIVREFLAPEYRRLVRLYKEHNVLIGFHSCGDISSVLEMFLELGIHVLNPVQATANNLDRVRAITQGRMALKGGVSSATVMDGPVDRIAEEIRLRIQQLGQEGGYFCAPDQGMPYPEEHMEAFREAVERYGRYPVG
jgi:uroporphyrinogen decarboxylase